MSWQRDARDPDAELVYAAQQDPERFVALYDRYVRRIQNYVRTRVANGDAADDAISQTFLTAAASRPGSFASRTTWSMTCSAIPVIGWSATETET